MSYTGTLERTYDSCAEEKKSTSEFVKWWQDSLDYSKGSDTGKLVGAPNSNVR